MSKSQFVVHQDMNLFGASIKAGTYVRQKEWVGLTDEEIWSGGDSFVLSEKGIRDFARAIEAKLKEKNA